MNKTHDLEKNASRILTDARLLVSIRDIPGFYFNRCSFLDSLDRGEHWGYDTTFFLFT